MNRQFPGTRQSVAEGFALHVWHHIVEEARGLTGIEQPKNVRVLEPRSDFDFARETLGTQGGGQLGAKHLHRHRPAVFQVLGEVHRGHAALTQLSLEAVAVGEGGRQARKSVGHLATFAAQGSGAPR